MHTADANNKVILNNFSEPLDLNKSITVMNSTRTYVSFDDELHSYRVKNHNKFTYEKQHSSEKSIHTCEMSNMFSDENNVNNNTHDNITRNTIAAGTKYDYPDKSSNVILNDILKLRTHIETVLVRY